MAQARLNDSIVSIDSLHFIFWIPSGNTFESAHLSIGTSVFDDDVYDDLAIEAQSMIVVGQEDGFLLYKVTIQLDQVQVETGTTYWITLSKSDDGQSRLGR